MSTKAKKTTRAGSKKKTNKTSEKTASTNSETTRKSKSDNSVATNRKISKSGKVITAKPTGKKTLVVKPAYKKVKPNDSKKESAQKRKPKLKVKKTPFKEPTQATPNTKTRNTREGKFNLHIVL